MDQKLWSKQDEETLLADNQAAVNAAAADYLATPPQALSTLFDYLYAELPADLAAQRQQLLTERGQA